MNRKCGNCAYILDRGSYYWCGHFWIDHEVKPGDYADDCSHHTFKSWIVTFTTKLLNMDKDNHYINATAELREKMEENPENKLLLSKYDLYGPIITADIMVSHNPKQVAQNIFDLSIKPVVDLIDEGKEEEALESYTSMVKMFVKELDYTRKMRDSKIGNKCIKEYTQEDKFAFGNPFVKSIKK